MISYPQQLKKRIGLLFILAIVFFTISPTLAAMRSQNYSIEKDSINFTGLDDGKSANYQLSDTGGEIAGQQNSANYQMNAGYQQSDYDPLAFSFTVNAQQDSSKVAYTAISVVASSVTVSSISGYAIGDYIGVLEATSSTYLMTFGKVVATGSNTLIVDNWQGDQATMTLSPTGGNDFVYKLTGNNIALGVIDTNSIKTAMSMFEVSANAVNGYSVDFSQNHNLQIDATHYINPVADSAVTIGSNEYGLHPVGPDEQGVGDRAASTTPQVIAQNSGRVSGVRTGSIYKAAVNNSAAVGHYSHSILYRATLNF